MTRTRNGTDVVEMDVADVLTDHPSWLVNDDGWAYRAVRCGTLIWTITCSPLTTSGRSLCVRPVLGSGKAPVPHTLDPSDLTGSDPVARALCEAGPVSRLRNPNLWDALATSIVRQVIRAGQARKLYRAFCRAHGAQVTTTAGTTYLFPAPDAVLALPDEEFARLGMAFKRRPLRAAAEAYLEFGSKWTQLDPSQLLVEIQHVPRIGPWTAGATVADVTNDYALYPFADLAVRTWAKRLAPELMWPETEPEFARVWHRLAGEQLSERTLLTLAWGVRHAAATGAVAV
jgi:DNA-3-methyladenine glycosylase II